MRCEVSFTAHLPLRYRAAVVLGECAENAEKRRQRMQRMERIKKTMKTSVKSVSHRICVLVQVSVDENLRELCVLCGE